MDTKKESKRPEETEQEVDSSNRLTLEEEMALLEGELKHYRSLPEKRANRPASQG